MDTCSILDLMRDTTRDTVLVAERRVGLDLLVKAESGDLVVLIADQVHTEFASHDQPVQDEAQRALDGIRAQIERINQVADVYGAPSAIDLSHLDDHVSRSRAIVGRWIAASTRVTPSADVPGRAFARVNAARAPATRAKDSSKDCLVFETYLEALARLQAAGFASPIVLLSSNTKDYLTESRVLKPEIAADLSPYPVTYAAQLGQARHALGF